MSDETDEYEVGVDPDDDMAVMLEAAEADLEAARSRLSEAESLLRRLEKADCADDYVIGQIIQDTRAFLAPLEKP